MHCHVYTARSCALAALLCTASAAPLAAQTTEWNVSLWGERRAFTEHVEHLARSVERSTRGDFVINISYGGLAPNRENLDGIQAGAFEMAQFCAGYHPEKNRAITALELPFIGVRTLAEELAASRALYRHPAVVAEMEQWNAHLLMPTPLPQYNLVGRGAPPEGLDWLDGRAVRATGGIANALGLFGAETLSLTATETYDALEGEGLDAVAFAQHAHFSFDTISLAQWWTTNLDPGSVNCPVVVNVDAYAALPPAHREALDHGTEQALDYYLQNYDDLILKWSEVLEVFGITTVTFSDQDLAALRAGSADVHANWIAVAESEGLPANDLLDTIADALTTHREAAF